MIHPESRKKAVWDLVILITSIYASIILPLSLAFELFGVWFSTISNLYIFLTFSTDIYINFNTAIKSEGELIEDKKEIARRYMKRWFWIDLVAALPLGIVFSTLKLTPFNVLVKALKLTRLFKLLQAAKIIRKVGGRKVNPSIMRLLLLSFWVFLAAHIIACAWIVVSGNPNNYEPTMLYVRAVYWSVTTLTTIGYGDIAPLTQNETLFVIFIELLGAGMYGLIIGNIANIIANIDIAKTQHREKLEKMNTFLNYRNIPSHLSKKINDYYNYLWETRRGYNESSVLTDLPEPLHVSVSLFLNKEIIEKVPIFQGASHELLKEIIMNLRALVFTPGDYIVTAGEVGYNMFFISKGSVDVVSADGNVVYATLQGGAFFGEIALLLSTPRTASIVANSYCDIYSLDKNAFDSIIQKYPKFAKNIKDLAEKRREEIESSQKPE